MTARHHDPEAWRVGTRVPEAVHVPATVEEVAALLAAASRDGTRMVPAGANGLPLMAVSALPPSAAFSVLSTSGLSGVVEYEPANLTLTAGAGTTLPTLSACTADHGQWLPVDPAGAERMTLGSLLATGADGPLRAGFGRPRDHALGLTVVTGDGRVVEAGGRVVKNVAGYDLVRLMVGSRGRLGVITSATMRLYPLPAADVTLVWERPGAGDAAALARRLGSLAMPVTALELVDAGAPDRVRVALRVAGGAPAVEEMLGLVQRAGGGEVADRLEGAASADFFAAMNRADGGAPLALQVGFLPDQLGEVVALVAELRDRVPGVRFNAHALSGSGRLLVDDPPASASRDGAVDDFMDLAAEKGFSCRIVRAPIDHLEARARAEGRRAGRGAPGGAGKAAASAAVLRIEAGLKAAFDPKGVLP